LFHVVEFIILKWIFNKQDGGVGCVDLAQDMDRGWALSKAAMNIQVPQNSGNILTS